MWRTCAFTRATKKQVKALFQQERAALLSLPPAAFPFFHEAKRTVHRDAHVEVDKAHYSVPPEYMGRTVRMRWDVKMVRVFNERLDLIATHLKHQPGRFRTDPKHIASEKISGVERGASYLLRRVSLIGPHSYCWAQRMPERRGIQGVRVLQGLLAVTRKYPADELERACQSALSHAAFRLQALRGLIKRPTRQVELIDRHPLIRPMDFYGRYVHVSFRKENDSNQSNANENDEFIALADTGGSLEAEEPVRLEQMGPPAVHPPASALGSLLERSPILRTGTGKRTGAKAPRSTLSGKEHPMKKSLLDALGEPAPERHGPVAGAAAPGSPGRLADPLRNSWSSSSSTGDLGSSIKRKAIYDLATGQFVRERKDTLFIGPPGVGKSHLCQAIGYEVIKAGMLVLYRSIFDLVRDFLRDEALGGEERILLKYLKPDLLVIDDMGLKQLPKRSGEYLF